MSLIKFDSNTQTANTISRTEFTEETSSVPQTAKIAFLMGTQDVLRNGNVFYTLQEQNLSQISNYGARNRTLNLKTFSQKRLSTFDSRPFMARFEHISDLVNRWPFISTLDACKARISHHPFFSSNIVNSVYKNDASGVVNIFLLYNILMKEGGDDRVLEVCNILQKIDNMKYYERYSQFEIYNNEWLGLHRISRDTYLPKSPFFRSSRASDFCELKDTYLLVSEIFNTDTQKSHIFICISNGEYATLENAKLILKDHFLRSIFSKSETFSRIFKGIEVASDNELDAFLNTSQKSKVKESCILFPHLQMGHNIQAQHLLDFAQICEYGLEERDLVEFLKRYTHDQKKHFRLVCSILSPESYALNLTFEDLTKIT